MIALKGPVFIAPLCAWLKECFFLVPGKYVRMFWGSFGKWMFLHTMMLPLSERIGGTCSMGTTRGRWTGSLLIRLWTWQLSKNYQTHNPLSFPRSLASPTSFLPLLQRTACWASCVCAKTPLEDLDFWLQVPEFWLGGNSWWIVAGVVSKKIWNSHAYSWA